MKTIRGAEIDAAVVLVGSAARCTQNESSDIDLLVISKDRLTHLNTPRRVHLVTSAYADYLKELGSGEDFECWCVRLGIPVYDNGLWEQILGSAEAKTWPNWRKKVAHAARRLFFANQMIEIGDLDAASEELLFATGHIARGLLLREGVFPLSRPELEDQAIALGYPHLAAVHNALRTNQNNSLEFLQRCTRYSKKLLLHLSKEEYEICVREHRRRKRSKNRLTTEPTGSH